MIKPIKMPQVSANMDEVVIVSWVKEQGDSVKVGDVLFEVETDKVVSEIESLEEGVLNKILIEAGSKVGLDEVVAEIETTE